MAKDIHGLTCMQDTAKTIGQLLRNSSNLSTFNSEELSWAKRDLSDGTKCPFLRLQSIWKEGREEKKPMEHGL